MNLYKQNNAGKKFLELKTLRKILSPGLLKYKNKIWLEMHGENQKTMELEDDLKGLIICI